MPINHLHLTLQRLLLQLRPDERVTRVRNFSRLLVSLCLSRSVHLSKIASKIPTTTTTTNATLPSSTRRLSPLLDNAAIRVRDWYEPIARSLLERAAKGGGEIRLVVDGSKVGFNHRLLMVGLAYRRRTTIPIAWSWVRNQKGHSSSCKQRTLLGYVRRLTPDGARVSVVGDSEFGAVVGMKQLEEWGFYYVLRQKGSHLVCSQPQQSQQQWRSLLGRGDRARGEKAWLEGALLSCLHAHQTNLLLYWKKGEKEPWLLATNLPSSKDVLQRYKKRMWIEGMFADFKGQGFDFESARGCDGLAGSRD